MTVTHIREYERRYGPYAFGVISLLIVWFSIVKPELNARRIDADAFSSAASQMQQTALQLHSTAILQQEIVRRLEVITDGLGPRR